MSSLGIFEVFFKLFIIAIVLFLAFIATRFVGVKYKKGLRGKNITVIESVSIGFDRILYIVKIGMQYFLIASSGKNIVFLNEIDPSNITFDEEQVNEHQQMFNVNGFEKYLDFFKTKQKSQKSSEKTNDFSQLSYFDDGLKGIDKNIDKIKDISKNIKTPRNGVE